MRITSGLQFMTMLVLGIALASASRDAMAASTCYSVSGLDTNPMESTDTNPSMGACFFNWYVNAGPGAGAMGQDQTTSVTDATYGVVGTSSKNTGVLGLSGATAGPTSLSAGVVGSGSGAGVYGGYFESDSSNGVYGSGGTGAVSGVLGVSSSTSGGGGSGVAGTNSSSGYGGYFESDSGVALYAIASDSADAIVGDLGAVGSGAHAGVKGISGSSSGYGVWGNNTSSFYGVYGTSSSGYGGYFTSSTGKSLYATGGGDTAIFGTYTGTGYPNGVQGQATSASGNGNGVYGYAHASGFGVLGNNDNGGTRVKGECSGTNCYAGWFAGATKLVGQVTVTGSGTYSGTWTPSSDVRFKKDIVSLKDGLADVLSLRPVTFKWKEPSKHGDYTATRYGFIAQEVEKVHAEWVQTDRDGFKSLDVDQFEAVEVRAIQTLKTENDELKKEIAALKAHNADNDDRLDAIERGHPRAPKSPIGFNAPTGVGAFGIIVGGIALLQSRKKKKEEKAS